MSKKQTPAEAWASSQPREVVVTKAEIEALRHRAARLVELESIASGINYARIAMDNEKVLEGLLAMDDWFQDQKRNQCQEDTPSGE